MPMMLKSKLLHSAMSIILMEQLYGPMNVTAVMEILLQQESKLKSIFYSGDMANIAEGHGFIVQTRANLTRANR